jgi:hypothetical protein
MLTENLISTTVRYVCIPTSGCSIEKLARVVHIYIYIYTGICMYECIVTTMEHSDLLTNGSFNNGTVLRIQIDTSGVHLEPKNNISTECCVCG